MEHAVIEIVAEAVGWEVVTAVTKVENLPFRSVTPVGGRVVADELTECTRDAWNLAISQMNGPVDVVFDNDGRLQRRVEEPEWKMSIVEEESDSR